MALVLLVLVAGQGVGPAEGSGGTDGWWRIVGKVAPGRVVSTVAPDARHTRESLEARRGGYWAHVAVESESGIVTGEALTKAVGTESSDPAVVEIFLDAEDDTCAWYGDSVYGAGDLRGVINDADHEGL